MAGGFGREGCVSREKDVYQDHIRWKKLNISSPEFVSTSQL